MIFIVLAKCNSNSYLHGPNQQLKCALLSSNPQQGGIYSSLLSPSPPSVDHKSNHWRLHSCCLFLDLSSVIRSLTDKYPLVLALLPTITAPVIYSLKYNICWHSLNYSTAAPPVLLSRLERSLAVQLISSMQTTLSISVNCMVSVVVAIPPPTATTTALNSVSFDPFLEEL